MDRAILVAQHGVAQAHAFHRALHARDPDDIAKVVLVLKKNKKNR
jgi:hypothetical protein